ncbi:MAG: chemotaxis protein CheW [Gammaproteobacteria bacterium]|nr:chemotaxis protein CheW [Gammaproteobacteria bacterium]
MAGHNSNILVDEKLAVSLFLDSLLREPEIETEVETPVVTPLTQPEPVIEIKPEVKIHQETEPVADISTETKLQVEEQKIVAESIVPEWAKQPFQVLLFDVAGLKLAVPLIELCGVIEWKDSVTEMPGHADFYMGILQHLNYKVAVIDTARMVLPANKLSHLAGENPRERVKHIVLIDDYRWGLACDKIGEVITLQPDEVRWRTSKTSRGWLAGTVIEHMCALLNSEGFAQMLANGR